MEQKVSRAQKAMSWMFEKGAKAGYRAWVCPTFENAFAFTEKVQSKGGGTILNILGEHHDNTHKVCNDRDKYFKLIDAIAERKKKGKLNAAISIKPSQCGYYVDAYDGADKENFTKDIMWSIIDRATSKGINVEIDVEKSSDHDFTYSAFKEFARRLKKANRGGMLGIAVQANYHAAVKRLEGLLSLDEKEYGLLKFRLVKGIYTPEKGDENAVSDETKTVQMYHDLVNTAVKHPGKHRIAFASHREDIVEKTRANDEVQMLAGIRYPFRVGLQKQGIPCWIYTPIGGKQEAAAYASRRAGKAAGLLWKTATDFFRPSIWRGTWMKKTPARQPA